MPTLGVKKPAAKKLAAPSKSTPARPAEDDDDAIEAARSKRSGPSANEGWEGGDTVGVDPDYIVQAKMEKGQRIVFRFLDNAPYANLRVHWVNRTGRRSFLCLQTSECPLCAVDAEVNSEHRFNIALLTPTDPALRSLSVSKSNFEEFKAWHLGERSGPLTKRFYARTRPKAQGGRFKNEIIKRASDINEDYDDSLHVPTDDELADLGRYTTEDVQREFPTMKELEAIAAEVTGNGDDDDDYDD